MGEGRSEDGARGLGGGSERAQVRVSGADTKANTRELWFERWAAYLSDCSVELPLRPSAIAAAPLGPSQLSSRLRGWGSEVSGEPCQWALT